MQIRYMDTDDDFDRDEMKYLQCEEREDYAEMIKMLKNVGNVLCKDGIARDIIEIEYEPEHDGMTAAIMVYLKER